LGETIRRKGGEMRRMGFMCPLRGRGKLMA